MASKDATNTELLSECVREALKRNGKLKSIKAEIKSCIFDTLNGEVTDLAPVLTSDNLIINELICEYLKFNNYAHSLHVFMEESDQPKSGLGRKTLVQELNVEESDSSQKLPLLYSLVHYFATDSKK